MKKISLTILVLLLVIVSFSQISEGGKPYSDFYNLKSDIEEIVIPEPDLTQVIAEDNQRERNDGFYRIARLLPVDKGISNAGTWTELPNGDQIWRLKISCNDAMALSLHYDDFYLPAKTKLFIYIPDKSFVIGGYTELINPASGYISTEMTPGDEVVLEYMQPASVNESPRLNVEKISYIYRGVKSFFGSNFFKATGWGNSDPCEVNINCPVGNTWQDEKRGVAEIYVVSGMSGGWCTGSLVNNTDQDCRALFLSADHCGGTSTQMAQWEFYFNYESSDCTTPATEPSYNTISGATLVARGDENTGSDFLLLELNTPVPDSYNPYYNGWDASGTAGLSGAGIHHPAGDIKKISTYTAALTSATWSGTNIANGHWQVIWTANANGHGVTEGGSSGSPIFNSDERIVGTLTGGSSFCTAQSNPDLYGKMDVHWDHTQNGTTAGFRLRDHLDPGNTGTTVMDGINWDACGTTFIDAEFTGVPTTIPVGSTVDFTDASTASGTIISWDWDFGGAGAVPLTQNTQGPHNVQYTNAGTYTVSLTVSDGTNSDTETKTDYIIVEDTVLNAEFTASVTTVNIGGTVDFTDLSSPSAQIVSWDWDFGDPAATPATSTVQGPVTVTYNTIGVHTVTLTVGDGTDTDTETKVGYIEVVDPNAVNADFYANVTTIVAGQSVDFFDDSQNGPAVSWDWDFGNGLTSSDQNPAGIVYANTGLYTVELTVTDGNSNTDTETKVDYIEVVDSSFLPVADFASNFTTVFVGNTVDFYDLTTNSPDTWEWIFDTGTPATSNVQNPTGILYDTPGIYDVTLIASNILGTDTVIKTGYITVIDSSFISDTLEARFDVFGSRLIVAGSSVSFKDESIGYPTTWEWDFGASAMPTISNIQYPIIQYNTPGIYDVTLIVSNGLVSDTLTKEDYIVVTSQPWQDPNGFCDTTSNIVTGEMPLSFRHLQDVWGYFPGHNGYNIRSYADIYTNYTISNVHGVLVPVVKAYSSSASAKVRFHVWDVDSLTGMPGIELGYKDVLISSFTPYIYHTVMFDNPIDMTGTFYVGFTLYYSSPQDTFVTYMAPDRGLSGNNTLVIKKGTWKQSYEVLPDTLNTSLAIELIGCLVSKEELDIGGEILVYPNPTNSLFNIEFNDVYANKVEILIFDMSGRLIEQRKLNSTNEKIQFDLSPFQQGMYFMSINLDGYNLMKKIMLTK